MKARYEASKATIEKQLFQYYDDVADGITQQAIAICLYTFHLAGWRKKRIQRLYEAILRVVDMPPVLGAALKAGDCMEFLSKRYEIDFNRVSVQKESFTQYRKR